MNNKVLLFIPMYNCEKQIVRVLDQLQGEILQYIHEVILVNNRSTDGGEKAVIDYISRLKLPIPVSLLRNHKNYGLGGSHKVAFEYAIQNKFDSLIVLHGDDQGHIIDILPLLKSESFLRYDCCLGARFMKGSKLEGYSVIRTFGNRVYNLLFSIATGKRIKDLGSGLNLYRVATLQDRFYHRFPDNLTFNCYMLLANDHFSQRTLFFPISWREDDQISNVKLFSQAIRTIKIAVGYLFSNHNNYLHREFRAVPLEAYTSDIIYTKEKC